MASTIIGFSTTSISSATGRSPTPGELAGRGASAMVVPWVPPYTTYRTPAGQPWHLTASPSGYTLTNLLTSEIWSFDNQGRLLSDTDAYGNSDTMSYGSGSATSLSNESNSGGRSLTLSYRNGQLSDARSPLWGTSGGMWGKHVTYGYNDSRQLTRMTRGPARPTR